MNQSSPESAAPFDIRLQHLEQRNHTHVFRVSYESDTDRWLLPYPEVTGLRFRNAATGEEHVWTTRWLLTEPEDFFVLVPAVTISFDLPVHINDDSRRWQIEIPPAIVEAQFIAEIDPESKTLQKHARISEQSLLAAQTKIWTGTIKTNVVQFEV